MLFGIWRVLKRLRLISGKATIFSRQEEEQTRLAEVETAVGNNQHSLARLRPMETEVSSLNDNYLKVIFYDIFGKTLLKNGEIVDGEKTLRSAVALAELQLESLHGLSSRAEWERNASDTYKDLIAVLYERNNREDAFRLWEEFKAAPVQNPDDHYVGGSSADHGRSGTHKMLSYHALRKATVVSYVVLPKTLLTWVADDRGLRSHRTDIPAPDVSAKVLHFRELCSTPTSDEDIVRKEARRLYDLLVAPIEQQLESGRTVCFELDDQLVGLPTEALLDSNNRYLGERFSILLSPGLFYEPNGSERSRITKHSSALVTAVSSPRYHPGGHLSPLADVSAEANMVAGQFPFARLLLEGNATLNKTLADIPSSMLFHFAGHGSNSLATPGPLLSDDGSKEADGPFNGAILATLPQRLL
jgi:hypothetical protein